MRDGIWLVAGLLSIGLLWALVVPPFEAPDESYYYKAIVEIARGGPRHGWTLYPLIMAPVMKIAGTPTPPFRAKYNPGFRFISNAPGRVNMFMHGRLEGATRVDIRRLYTIRVMTLGLWLIALWLVFDSARMFFARTDLAALTVGLCFCLPGVSFFASKVHTEATVVVLASLALWTVSARMLRRIGRPAAWAIGLTILGLTPLSDHQTYFLFFFVPLSLVASEDTWKGRVVAAIVLMIAGGTVFALGATASLRADLVGELAPFMPSYQYGWWSPDTLAYLIVDFLPRMFLGFIGFLGQPSLLLPPSVYAGVAVVFIIGAVGTMLPRPQIRTPAQRRLAWIFAAGVALAFAPILYTNIVVDRTAYGRWMYSVIGPIMIGVVSGWTSVIDLWRRRPHVVALGFAGLAAALGAMWLGTYGDSLRLVIRGNHYGDTAHLIRALGVTIAFLGCAAAAMELAALVVRRRQSLRLPSPNWIVAGMMALNLALLFGFVAPLYQQLDDRDLAGLIREDASKSEYRRAAALYHVALAAYPQSSVLRQISRDTPMILLRGDDEQLLAGLLDQIAHGDALQTREELLALTRVVPLNSGIEPELLRQVAQRAHPSDGTNEPLALLRAEFDGRQHDGSAAADVIRAGRGTLVRADMHGDAVLEGFTHYQELDHREVTVYFRPLRTWQGRRLWMHIYPPNSREYTVADSAISQFDGWQPGELAWERFQIPLNAPAVLYVGVEFQHDLGSAYFLGRVD
jgi:hypothetical protein